MRAAVVSSMLTASLIASACATTAHQRTPAERDPGALAAIFAQDDQAVKSPAVALGFAWLCPGCGHLYTGETTKGALIAAASVGAVATGFAVQLARTSTITNTMHERCALDRPFSDCTATGMDFTPILIGGAIGLAGYVYGLIDAGASARRMNARRGLGMGGVDLQPSVQPDGSLRAQVNVRLPARR